MRFFHIFTIIFLFSSCGQTAKHENIDTPGLSSDSSIHNFRYQDYISSSRMGFPDDNPFCSIRQMVGVDMITLVYYRVKDLDVKNNFDDLFVKQGLDSIWFINNGRNIPLQFSTTSSFYIKNTFVNDTTIEGLNAGTYSIFIKHPFNNDTDWYVCFNTAKIDSEIKYDPSKDMAKLKINLKQYISLIDTDEILPELSIQITHIKTNSAFIEIGYERKRFEFKIIFDNNERIKNNISRYLYDIKNEPENKKWGEYNEAATFYSTSHFDSINYNFNNSYNPYFLYSLDLINSAITFHDNINRDNIEWYNEYSSLIINKIGILAKLYQYDSIETCYNKAVKILNPHLDNKSTKVGIDELNKYYRNIEHYKSISKK